MTVAGTERPSPSTKRDTFQKEEEISNGRNSEADAQSNRSGGRRGTYEILVDGQRAGSLDMNDTIEIPVEPGRHALQVRNGRNSSGTQTFDAVEGETVAFRCTGKRLLPLFLASFAVPSLAIKLKRE